MSVKSENTLLTDGFFSHMEYIQDCEVTSESFCVKIVKQQLIYWMITHMKMTDMYSGTESSRCPQVLSLVLFPVSPSCLT